MKLSTNSTTSTIFDRATLCAIIDSCSKAGVRDFEYQGLKLHYKDVYTPDTAPVHVSDEIVRKQDSQAKGFHESQEAELRQSQLEQMLIEDPQGYEEIIRSGDAK